jgi:hypothetical protein
MQDECSLILIGSDLVLLKSAIKLALSKATPPNYSQASILVVFSQR